MTTQPLRREFKVTSLPASPQPDTIYYVKGPSDATARHYVTDTEGAAVEVKAEDAAALVAAHEAASDPHPGYLTTAEGNATFVRSVNGTGPNGSGDVSVSGGAWGSITGSLSSQTDLQSALDLKAALASPTFTGTPLAPTAAPGTNTTQMATTAFSAAAILAASAANWRTI